MNVLLDTHILLWALAGSPRVEPLREMLLDEQVIVHVSVASLWELAIKIGLGKLDADVHDIRQGIAASGFRELPVLGEHTEQLRYLPLLHRDPFDRLLVAQAMAEPMRLYTADVALKPYSELVEVVG
jgi:PIN domain nuclease of toxin-antitoxin system